LVVILKLNPLTNPTYLASHIFPHHCFTQKSTPMPGARSNVLMRSTSQVVYTHATHNVRHNAMLNSSGSLLVNAHCVTLSAWLLISMRSCFKPPTKFSRHGATQKKISRLHVMFCTKLIHSPIHARTLAKICAHRFVAH
jgi:hypothetical protein